jgi:hypothetical protein
MLSILENGFLTRRFTLQFPPSRGFMVTCPWNSPPSKYPGTISLSIPRVLPQTTNVMD